MKNFLNSFEFPFWKTVTILVILNILIFSLLILVSPENLKIQYIPDDAFYYLTLSRNFAALRYWTFDSGVSVTSGFHPLFAYLLATIFSLIQPDSTQFVLSGLVVSLIFGFVSVFIITFIGIRQRNTFFLMFVAFIFSSQNFIFNTVSITEWSLTLLITLLYVIYFYFKFQEKIQFVELLILFTLGFLGSVARADFGLLPFSIAFATIVLFLWKTISGKKLIFSLVGLLGAVVGLLSVFIHNFLFTGEYLQSSAKMKASWTQSIFLNYLDVVSLFLKIMGVFGFFIMLIVTVKMIVYIVFRFRTFTKNRSTSNIVAVVSENIEPTRLLMIVSSFVCLLGYSVVYTRNSAIQAWYSANLIVPLLLFVYGISNLVFPRLGVKLRLFFMTFFLLAMMVRIVEMYPLGVAHSPWPHQEMMRTAGLYLHENETDFVKGRIGAWNAGIIGYYQGGTVVNLDGLVNNNIYTFAVQNDLPSYISEQNILYILDFERMILNTDRRVRGGYDDNVFLEKLIPIKIFNNNGTNDWINLTLYQVINP